MKLKKIKCAFCPNWFVPENQRQKYCLKECYNKAKRIRENKTYNAKQLARFNLPAGTHKMCQACPNPITEYGFHVACSQECRNEIDERNCIQAQKKPCKRCGHDITRARYHKYCSDKCRYEAWRDGKRKHPKNSNCRRCKNVITDKKQLVYCTAECRLEHIREKYDEAHAEKKCERCKTTLVNTRRTYCTAKCRRLFNLDREEKRDAKKAEAVRAAKADPNYLKNQVKKVQREAEERRRALHGLS